jgi:hypothetical protein
MPSITITTLKISPNGALYRSCWFWKRGLGPGNTGFWMVDSTLLVFRKLIQNLASLHERRFGGEARIACRKIHFPTSTLDSTIIHGTSFNAAW